MSFRNSWYKYVRVKVVCIHWVSRSTYQAYTARATPTRPSPIATSTWKLDIDQNATHIHNIQGIAYQKVPILGYSKELYVNTSRKNYSKRYGKYNKDTKREKRFSTKMVRLKGIIRMYVIERLPYRNKSKYDRTSGQYMELHGLHNRLSAEYIQTFRSGVLLASTSRTTRRRRCHRHMLHLNSFIRVS